MSSIEEKICKVANKFAEQEAEIGEIDRDALYKGFYHGAKWALSHQWVSVEKALPKDDARVLVMLDDSNHPCFGVFSCLRWEVESADMVLLSDVDDIRVTHWMPIPPLPGARKEGEE